MSRIVVEGLTRLTKNMDREELIVYVYNSAIEDALDFIEVIRQHNPQSSTGFLSLIETMKPLLLETEENNK